ncbi:MAG: hypothetical protein ACTHJK_01300 [Sphingomicrobium sp.]
MANRIFKVIEGGSGGDKTVATYINSSAAGEGGGGGGFNGGHAVTLGKLEQSVGWLWKAVGTTFVLGLGAIIALYLLLAGRIDDRYDKIGNKLDHITDQIADLRVAVTRDGINAGAVPEKAPKKGKPGSPNG